MSINKINFKSVYAEIDSHGAELKSLKLNSGREILWNADSKYWGKTSPVLFPVVGALRGNKTVFDIQEYTIPKHGFARDMEFTFSKIAENDITFRLESSEETLKMYPYPFKLEIHYTLYSGRIKIQYTVYNKGYEDMYYCIGAHPAFFCPFSEGESFSDYKLQFEKPETIESPLFDATTNLFNDRRKIKWLNNESELNLNHNMFINDCIYFNTIESKSVILKKEGAEKTPGIKLEWKGFETLGIWSPAGLNAPFVCLEPWCGSADFTSDMGFFKEKAGVQTLAGGETKKYSLVISEVL